MRKHISNLYQLFSFTQLIEEPTRATLSSATIIYHITTTCPRNIIEAGVPKISLSDHYMLKLQNLMTEIYIPRNLINPAYMWEFFVEKDMPYNLRTKVLCRLPQAQTNRYGLDSLSFRGSLLWNTLKDEVKRAGTLTEFKKSIVKWDGKSCNCLICK